jgi:ElaB/YqjD/DUF883 family membrane-anchored ribosome-binding protein
MPTNGSRIEEATSKLEAQASRLGAQMDVVRDYAGSADEMIRAFARERPLAAIGIAVGVGFLLGRLAART